MKRLAELLSFSVWAVCTLRYWFPRVFAAIGLGLGFAALVVTLALSGCASHRPVTDQRPNAELVAPPVGLDTAVVTSNVPANVTTKPGLLSGIGRVFSTPEGIARRQAVRLAKASTPHGIKVKDGAFSWNGDAVAIGKKAGPSIVKSDSATQQVATNAVAGHGNTATQTATTPEAPGFWATLGKPLGYAVSLVLLAVGAYLVYLIWAFIPRRKDNQA
jgi:hypothetical protein